MKYILIENGEHGIKEGDLGLEDMQKIVGGWIEHVTLAENPDGSVISLYCNEEGKIDGLYPNFYLPVIQDTIMGNAIICATDAQGDTRSLTPDEINRVSFLKQDHTFILGLHHGSILRSLQYEAAG